MQHWTATPFLSLLAALTIAPSPACNRSNSGLPAPNDNSATPLQQAWSCYAEELKENPQLQGDLVLSIQIAPDGHAHGAQIVSNSLADQTLGLCVISAANTWKFENKTSHSRATDVASRIPFHFNPAALEEFRRSTASEKTK